MLANRSLDDPTSLLRPYNHEFIAIPIAIMRVIHATVESHSHVPERAGEPASAAEFDAANEWIVSELAGGERAPGASRVAVTTERPRGAEGP